MTVSLRLVAGSSCERRDRVFGLEEVEVVEALSPTCTEGVASLHRLPRHHLVDGQESFLLSSRIVLPDQRGVAATSSPAVRAESAVSSKLATEAMTLTHAAKVGPAKRATPPALRARSAMVSRGFGERFFSVLTRTPSLAALRSVQTAAPHDLREPVG
jgi:hypothetical protein